MLILLHSQNPENRIELPNSRMESINTNLSVITSPPINPENSEHLIPGPARIYPITRYILRCKGDLPIARSTIQRLIKSTEGAHRRFDDTWIQNNLLPTYANIHLFIYLFIYLYTWKHIFLYIFLNTLTRLDGPA